MEMNLVKASIENAEEIHQTQIKAFRKLLEKYEDYTTSPTNENIDKIIG
jgi:hypothetical protein